MKIVKVRRIGNSNMVALPRALETLGYQPGEEVTIDELPNGELRLIPTARMRSQLAALAHEVNEDNREAMDRLAEYDRRGVSAP
jgi:antitoxin component of MazEF toxin-antitoxin module